MELQVTKRTGHVVAYDVSRIQRAISKALAATKESASPELLNSVVADIDGWVRTLADNDRIPSVEQIQDTVEKSLMKHRLFDTAKAYILYRLSHTKIREVEQLHREDAAVHGVLLVQKRQGTTESFSVEKIRATLKRVCAAPERVDATTMLLKECLKTVYELMPTAAIQDSLILCATSFIERDPFYDGIAADLFRQKIYKEVFGCSVNEATLDKQYRSSFIVSVSQSIGDGLLDPKMKRFDIEALASALQPSRDWALGFMGLQTLYERYFLKCRDGHRLETPQAFWMRVAMGIALNEEKATERAVAFYEVLSTLRFVPSTPTLFHAGTHRAQLSSCYVTTIGDDLSAIFKCLGDNAQYAKWSGGLGNDWTSVRATGAPIASTRVESQGVVPFLKIANDVTMAINRSGKRRGATCAYLETWHLDIEDFLDLRRNTGDDRRRTHDMNTAHWIPDLFMKRVFSQGRWTLFSPDDVADLHELYGLQFEQRYHFYEQEALAGRITHCKTVDALMLWRKMLTRLFETGHPWITFKDPCNVRSPQDHVGVIHSSNLCTEITLNTSATETAVCNLGSVNLAAHMSEAGINEEHLAATIHTAMRMLDNVIDINFYPTEESRRANLRHRPLGLGIMGLQDALFMRRMPFDSKDALALNDTIMEMVSFYALHASADLAQERGAYESFKGSKWSRGILPFDTIALLAQQRDRGIVTQNKPAKDWDSLRRRIVQYGIRNSNCMAIAPTATIATIAGCYPSIEPAYKNMYVKANISGEFVVVNKYLVADLKKLGIWSDELRNQIKFADGSIAGIEVIPLTLRNLYKEAFEVDVDMLLQAAAIRGAYIDQSQSLNIFVKGTKGKILDDIYKNAWEYGLKTTYYLRTLAATQVEKSTLDTKFGFTQMRREASEGASVPDQLSSGQDPAPQQRHLLETVKACSLLDPECESCQ